MRFLLRSRGGLSAGLMSAALLAGPAAAAEWLLASELTYASGDYGTEETSTSLYAPIELGLRGDLLWASIEAGYLRTEGPVTAISSVRYPRLAERLGLPTSIATTSEETAEGLSDIRASIGVSLPEGRRTGVFASLVGSVKVPTASEEDGLGTGAPDYTLEAELARPIGRAVPYVSFGYDWLGDGGGFELSDTPFATLGLDLDVHPRAILGVAYDWADAASAEEDDFQRIGGSLTFFLTPSLTLSGDVAAGLSDAASDISGGLRVSFASPL